MTAALLYPKGHYRPLSSKQTQPHMSAHDVVCVHTMDGYLKSTERMFDQGGFTGLESHYGIGGAWGPDAEAKLDGVVYQFQDRDHTADANLDGNPYVISIETGDNAPKSAAQIAGWTRLQLDSLVDLIAWECSLAAHAKCPPNFKCHQGTMWNGVRVAIPPVLIPDTKRANRGLAVHRQGVPASGGPGSRPGYLAKGGVQWSTAVGKACPGDARIKQFTTMVIPRVQATLAPVKAKPATPPPPKEGKIVADDATKAMIREIVIDVLKNEPLVANKPSAAQLTADPKTPTTFWSVAAALSNVEGDDDNRSDATAARLDRLGSMLEALLSANSIPIP